MLKRRFCLVLLACNCLSAGEPAPDNNGTLILDESAYWRYYVVPGQDRISTKALKENEQKMLSDVFLKRLENQTRKRIKDKDWAAVDWMTEARYMIARTQIGSWGNPEGPVQFDMDYDIPPPPAAWMNADFDDSTWPRQRLPFLMGPPPALVYEFAQPQTFGWQRACYRTRFMVDDPGAVKDLILRLTYRGGARVFINGKEIARGNLPEGEWTDNVWAEDYPLAAYLAQQDEAPGKETKQIGELKGGFPDGLDPQKLPEFRRAGNDGRGGAVNRKGWERLSLLRNRVLKPAAIPSNLLRKGANSLAIEVRASQLHPAAVLGGSENLWYHTGVIDVQLQTASPAVHASLRRPAGVQVWAEEACRRILSAEFLEAGAGADKVRIAGARNGVYAAQVVVGTDKELTGLKVKAGGLKSDNGAVIPDSAVRVQYLIPHSLRELTALGLGRNLDGGAAYQLVEPVDLAFMRHAVYSGKSTEVPGPERLAKAAEISFFDHIGPQPPEKVPPNTCQPVWLSVKIPADAAPGKYQGTVSVEAQGMAPAALPVEVEVFDWRLPDTRDFTVYMALEQSPYGVARQYKVPLWSDKHFELIEASFRELARIGNTWLYVPVILDSEFGNFGEYQGPPMIQWIRKKDGSLAFDYGVMDRYVDLAVKHWGKPRGICFAIMQVGRGRVDMGLAKVLIRDESSGKTEELNLVTANPEYEKLWTSFALATYRHMQEKGLEKALYWGNPWDSVDDPNLIALLGKHVPQVGWASAGHGIWVGSNPDFKFSSAIHIAQDVNKKGWKRSMPLLCNPRDSGALITAQGISLPFSYRLAIDRAMVSGCNGVGRWGADYWQRTFGIHRNSYFAPGIGCVQIFWPGPAGAESSARFEAAIEGVEETEARIFIEQAIEHGLLDKDLAERAAKVLWDHTRSTLFISPAVDIQKAVECVVDWQGDSRRIYRMAAEIAAKVLVDVENPILEVEAPARGKTTVSLVLRNWTSQPRACKIVSKTQWIVPAQLEVTVPPGRRTMTVAVDTQALTPKQKASGNLMVVDAATGLERPVEIRANVGGIFDFIVGEAYDFLGAPGHAGSFNAKRIEDQAVFNVPVGGEDSKSFLFVNRTGSDLSWKIESPSPWLKAEPAAGALKPLERIFVKVTAKPADTQAATFETVMTIADTGGALTQKAKFITHVIPPYRAPELPKGEAIRASTLPAKTAIKGHKSIVDSRFGSSTPTSPAFGPAFDKNGNVYADAPIETTWKLEGSGFTAFSVKVHVDPEHLKQIATDMFRRRLNFELHVDGKVCAQSGLVKSGDEPRLLVAESLMNAKDLRIVTRFDTSEAGNLGPSPRIFWIEPTFYKAK